MGHKTTYILQVILAITGLIALFTIHWIAGILLIICSYLVWKNKLENEKTNWLDLYNSQNRGGKRKMKADLKKRVLGKAKFR